MICALLVRGADPTIENFEGENAIHYGLLRGKDPVYSEGRGIPISDLLRKASSVTKGQFLNAIRQSQRKKASHYLNYVPLSATEATFQDLVKATDHAGNNALHLAVLAGKSPGTVRTLLEHRVNPHKPNNVNKTPINLAIEIHDKSPSPENSKIFAILTEEYEDD